MGSGKTTVGKKLANLLNYDFVDLDQEIIKRTGVSIAHIFEVEKEEGFRDRESKLLKELSEFGGQVVSTGGGIIVRNENIAVMQQTGKVIYLNAPIGILWNRLKDCQHRPLLRTVNPRQKMQEIMRQRAPLYDRAAHIELKVATDSAMKTARRIRSLLENK